MTHTSPAVSGLWAILSILLFGFLISHLWQFDRFQCLRWGHGRQTGRFKRVMTYSYLLSIPLLIVNSIGMAWIKYREGFISLPGIGIYPMPYEFWSKSDQNWILPLYLCFSVGWGLEIVSHLEELCFWLFLINASATTLEWFRSIHFKVWVLGSLAAVAGMPLVTIFTRENPLKCEAWTYFAGSMGSLCLTLWFMKVLWQFPRFLRRVKAAGGEPEVVVRLTTFHDLNITRVIFRFIFVVPFVLLSSDGIKKDHNHINESLLWTDVLAMLGAIGCVVSSAITLLIFFPRSISHEAGYRPRQKSSQTASNKASESRILQPLSQQSRTGTNSVNQYPSIASPPQSQYHLPSSLKTPFSTSDLSLSGSPELEDREIPVALPATVRIAPPGTEERRAVTGGGMWEMVDMQRTVDVQPSTRKEGRDRRKLPMAFMKRPNTLHPLVLNYISPIDLAENAPSSSRSQV